jgi:hypothetical protein
MTRRIKRELQKFFEEKPLTSRERSFILGCINAQTKYPQLTARQWNIICEIEERYKNGKSE